jgi:hypothetical protein
MNFSPHLRTMTGLMTVGIFGMVAASAWPTTPWLTAITGGLAIVRLVVVFRQWPSKQ